MNLLKNTLVALAWCLLIWGAFTLALPDAGFWQTTAATGLYVIALGAAGNRSDTR